MLQKNDAAMLPQPLPEPSDVVPTLAPSFHLVTCQAWFDWDARTLHVQPPNYDVLPVSSFSALECAGNFQASWWWSTATWATQPLWLVLLLLHVPSWHGVV